MTDKSLTARDYPLAETAPDRIAGKGGKTLDQLTLEAAVAGDLSIDDLRITEEALIRQAEIARSVERSALAENFERAAEMTRLPQEEIMGIYELLRPGRAKSRDELTEAAERLRNVHAAPRLAHFVETAATVYDRRQLYRTRY